MNSFRARVRQGRIVLDEPTDLPEGTEVELSVCILGDEDRARLDAAIDDGLAEMDRGETAPADVVLARLRIVE